MKLFAPSYYQKFNCVADKCRHSCCIGWEIDVDKKTLKKYKKLGDKAILASIDSEGTPHFRLGKGERCLHLDERGLCRIISAYGDGCLCDICREHPRFYNETARGREAGLGMVCEEACRLILTSQDYVSLCEIGKERGRWRRSSFDALPERERIYAILSDKAYADSERRERIASLYGLSLPDDDKCRALLATLEYMTEENRTRFASAYHGDCETPKEIEPFLRRTLAYFVFRHVTAAKNADDLRAAVGFSLFCERLLCSLAVAENALTLDAFSQLARTVSEEIEYSEDNTEALMLVCQQKNRF